MVGSDRVGDELPGRVVELSGAAPLCLRFREVAADDGQHLLDQVGLAGPTPLGPGEERVVNTTPSDSQFLRTVPGTLRGSSRLRLTNLPERSPW